MDTVVGRDNVKDVCQQLHEAENELTFPPLVRRFLYIFVREESKWKDL